MDIEGFLILLLLLSMAVASGWYIAKTRFKRGMGNTLHNIPPEYLKGLNFVLNEQQDKAIDIFIKMLEVDSDTVETHLALGNLFRRRGEVDRAIRIHQNLIARPTLTDDDRALALLELGTDYMRSGLFDRAEGLFRELVDNENHSEQALAELLDIYQQEKDWQNAVMVAKRLEIVSGERLYAEIAQFHCELAELDLHADNEKDARNNIKRAPNIDPKCIRASILEGQLEQKQDKPKAALRAYKRAVRQDMECLPEILEPMQECYRRTGKLEEYMEYLDEVMHDYKGITPVLYRTGLIEELRGEQEAVSYISSELKRRPTVRGVDRLLDYILKNTSGEIRDNLTTIKELTARLLTNISTYKCNQCGFDAKKIHWQCPSCKHWNTIKMVHGVEGE